MGGLVASVGRWSCQAMGFMYMCRTLLTASPSSDDLCSFTDQFKLLLQLLVFDPDS
jgi:hypothetical protein